MILEIGPPVGDRTFAGSVTVDCLVRDGVDFVARWGYESLPFPDQHFDYVYSSHVLEHISWMRTKEALREVWRILRPGGRCEIWVPDFAIICRTYALGQFPPDDWTPHNEERSLLKWVAGRLFCGLGEGEGYWHRACFDAPYLKACFCEAGFAEVQQLVRPPDAQRVNHEFINLGVSGIRPEA